ncbi:hypothetical protein AVHY2522_24710 [Acidovorax sp. SUPP2522]|uniref:hypothetical protein n=1 Tax=unclassified Acidovorax TaxID=2684926 RepID=UPI002349BBDA|nr:MULTISPECIES: hypothetical protein [unclassified Acidovorax]WCM97949.1 hypothetical protein M5C96_00200 [Acidovorax sp. GBBC 1281]GKT00775.1 hypothetical protein AVKW3434_15320 [Acidovorax sp. SUPP3434]GKT20071.1 hypothetical protein AVHY2522_24710 [Acidovorax sp. SUPP2522]
MKHFAWNKIPCIVWCLALNAALFLAWYLSTPALYNRYNSPLHTYRLEIYDASWWQRVQHLDSKKPSVVRLYHSDSQALLGTSPVVDLWRNDAIVWSVNSPGDDNHVRVGKDVRFDKLRSECAPPSPLRICEQQQ